MTGKKSGKNEGKSTAGAPAKPVKKSPAKKGSVPKPVLTAQERRVRETLRRDFGHYAEKCLKIRSKSGAVVPLQLNQAQQFLHQQLEAQKAQTARVRAIILKGRQQGCSTYVQGRFFWQVTHRFGARAFILTHTNAATETLFDMVDRFRANCPPLVLPDVGTANARELGFERLDSGYKVGTAGARSVGRSHTIQLFHGSEVAFWPYAQEHAAGVLQAVPNAPGTEVILESTANGMGNVFHKMWQQASDTVEADRYLRIFIPWFWQAEYQVLAPTEVKLTQDERAYSQAHGLSAGQMLWRRMKIRELGSEFLFRQEYPATAAEAFQVSGENSLIRPEVVLAARRPAQPVEAYGPKVAGCDPARFGQDSTCFVLRQGRVMQAVERYEKLDTMAIVGLCGRYIRQWGLERLFVDVIGIGAGVVDRLRELGYGRVVTAVNAAGRAQEAQRYHNCRAEMWDRVRQWLEAEPVQIMNDDRLHADLIGPSFSFDSNGCLKLESKDSLKKRGLPSPDTGDALALTFALPVAARSVGHLPKNYLEEPGRGYDPFGV